MSKKVIFKIFKWFGGIFLSLILVVSLILYLFKDEICSVVIQNINKHLTAEIKVSKVDLAFWGSFPNLSVDFDDVFIQDPRDGKLETDTLLYSEKIRLKFNPMDIWNKDYTLKSIEIHPGSLSIDVDSNGVSNYDIFIAQKDSIDNSNFSMNLKHVEFLNFNFNYSNQISSQTYQTKINSMELIGAFNSAKFSSIANCDLNIISAKSGRVKLISNQPAQLNIQLDFNKDSSSITIPQSTIYISELPFKFEGHLNKNEFHFNLNGNNLNINEVAHKLALRASKDVKKLDGNGKLLFDLNFDKVYANQEVMSVNCEFGVNNATLTEPTKNLRISALNLKGKYQNRQGRIKENLTLEDISFRTKAGKIQGDLKITNFNNPIYKGHSKGVVDLGVINQIFPNRIVEKVSGNLAIDAQFNIRSKHESDNLNYYIQRCSGDVDFKNINLKLAGDQRYFEKINGDIFLRNNSIGINQFRVKINSTDLELSGSLQNISNYLMEKDVLKTDIHISSNTIKLEDLATTPKEVTIQDSRRFILPNDVLGSIYLDVKKLTYDQQKFEDIKGNMTIDHRKINLKTLSVKNGGAQIQGSLEIHEKTPELFYISSRIVSKNIDFGPLFKEWDNFKQDVIKASNIEGVAQANVTFSAPFDLRSGIISKSIVAQIGIQIDKGRLKNVDAFQSIINSAKSSSAKTIIGEENLDYFGGKLKDLKFKRLKNTFYIQDGILTIPNMSIESSALDIEISGNHTFSNKIDYRFGFRLKDLKKKEESEFGEIVDDGSGVNIFMRMYGDLSNPKFEWDKEARKANSKENRAIEKENIKSILKSQFGLFKKDSTVNEYIAPPELKEEFDVKFDPINEIEEVIKETKPKKDTKLMKKLRRWKKEDEEDESQDDFEVE